MSGPAADGSDVLVTVPTYNERESLPRLVTRLLDTLPGLRILVVDDGSPDGTGTLAEEIAAADHRVRVHHHAPRAGLGAAYVDAFSLILDGGWGGFAHDIGWIVQMDADGSHAPEELGRLLGAIDDGADLVIGSRYIDGGEVKNWPKNRYLLSKLGNEYIALALGGDVKDMTAGYRAFKRETLEALDFDALSGKGYIFQVEVAHKAEQLGFDVREVPVTFEDRKLGESKLDASFAAASLAEVTKWGVQDKATIVKDLSTETGRQIVHAAEQSKLSGLGKRIEGAPEQVVNAISEFVPVVKHEVEGLQLGSLRTRAARRTNDAINLGAETIRQALHALGLDSKK